MGAILEKNEIKCIYKQRRPAMSEQEKLANRIKALCKKKDISYYTLSYRSAVPMTTLMHIIDGSTQNPGIFTICKLCGGLSISL